MAQVIRFASPVIQERENILAEIRKLASACGMTWDQVTYFACGKDKTWEEVPLDFLYGPLNILRAEVAELESKAASVPAMPPNRGGKVIPFVSPSVPGESAHAAAKRIVSDMHAIDEYRSRVITVVHSRQTKTLSDAELAHKKAGREAHRKMMIAKVHIFLSELYGRLDGFTEDVYRFILQEQWGVNSSTQLTNEQLHSLLVHLQAMGTEAKWRKGERGKRDKAPATLKRDTSGMDRTGLMRKIEAMLAEKGAEEDASIPWAYGVGILKRQTGGVVTRFEDATPEQLSAVIAALYYDAKRKGRCTK